MMRLRELQAEKERRQADRQAAGAADYLSDPAGFARDCIAWPKNRHLFPYQSDVLEHLVTNRRVAVRGPRGLGKTTISALTVLWFALTRDAAGIDWKIGTTAGSFLQVSQFTWSEIHKWARLLKPEVLGRGSLNERTELLTLKIRLRFGEAFAASVDNPYLIEGAHADQVLFVFDESKAIASSVFDSVEGTFSNAGTGDREAYALSISTPGEPAGFFYDIHARRPGTGHWWARHVTKDEAIAAGAISADWCEQSRLRWGEDSALYHNHVLGEFYSADEDGVIPLSWAEAAIERWRAWDKAGRPDSGGPHVIGVDVARTGSDKTVIALRDNWVIKELRATSREDTMSTAGRVAGILDSEPGATAAVDVIGVGAGVYDRLREQGHNVEAFNASAGTRRRDASNEFGFANCLTGDARVRPVGRLLRIYRSRYDGPLYRIKMASGDEFTATPHHNVLTPQGWAPVKALHVGDKLCDAATRELPTAVDPYEGNMPSTIGEIYHAAKRSSRDKRVTVASVNFHGDVAMGEVEVVEVNSDLLPIDPPLRQESANSPFVRPLHRLVELASDRGCPHALGLLRDESRDSDGPFPRPAPIGRLSRPLFFCNSGRPKAIGFNATSNRYASLGKDAAQPVVGGFELSDQRLCGFAGDVPGRECFLVHSSNSELAHFFVPAKNDSSFLEDASDHVGVNSEVPAEHMHGLARRVAVAELDGVDVPSSGEANRFHAATWLDSVFDKDLANGGPVSPEVLLKRCGRLAREIPLDEIVSIELTSSAHEDTFVYTLETSTGSYRTSSVVHRNCRAAAHWNLRELLDPSRRPEVALPPDDELLGDLTAVHWRVMSGGKIQVESKDDIKKRIGRSPDRSDAVMIALWVGGVSWAEAYGFIECPHCGEMLPEETDGTPASVCTSCGKPVGSRTYRPEPKPEPGQQQDGPRNPWMDVYGSRGAR